MTSTPPPAVPSLCTKPTSGARTARRVDPPRGVLAVEPGMPSAEIERQVTG